MPSVNVKGSDENIIEKVLVLQPNVSAEDLQTIQEYVVSATATRINDLEAQVDTLEPIIQNIDTSEANAKASEDNAKISEDNAEDYSLKSQSYAVGTNNTYRSGDATDNAEYYKNQCEAIASSLAGALRPMGTIAFANLPALSTADVGDMYNISDDFVTTSDFTVGAGISYPAGSNVYNIQSDKWDVLVGSSVIGVKGDAESNYRKGNINITPANIGAYSKSEIDNTVSGLATKTYVNDKIADKINGGDNVWFPDVYDLNTKTKTLTSSDCLTFIQKIGEITIAYLFAGSGSVFGTFSVMAQLRNFPNNCTRCLGGVVYNNKFENAPRTIQASEIGVYFRPNISDSFGTGVVSMLLFFR